MLLIHTGGLVFCLGESMPSNIVTARTYCRGSALSRYLGETELLGKSLVNYFRGWSCIRTWPPRLHHEESCFRV